MLSWSGPETTPTEAAVGMGEGDAGLPHGSALLRFAEAIAGFDDHELVRSRDALIGVAGEEFTIDAAAVAANFEMMTRVADGTGARFASAQADKRAHLGQVLDITERAEADF